MTNLFCFTISSQTQHMKTPTKNKTQLTKLIRAIQIFPLVFQLIVDDTKNITEHNARLHCMAIGIHVSQ